jgi:hypothetical protein
MMARTDFDIKSVVLPPVSEKDIPDLLKFKLRSVYPGTPEETVFDYTILGTKNKKCAVLFITEKRIIEKYRDLSGGKPLFLPYTLLKPLIEISDNENRVFMYYHKTWIEIMLIQDGICLSSFVLQRHASFDVNYRRFEKLLPEPHDSYSFVCVCAEEDEISLAEQFKANLSADVTYRMVCIEELLSDINRKAVFLFSEKQKRLAIPNRLLVYLYPVFFLILAFLIFNKSMNRRKTYYDNLERRLRILERQTLSMAALEKEVKALEDEWIKLYESSPHNIYFVLSELSGIMGGRAVITHFVIEKDSFQIEAMGQNPLDLMEKFRNNENFQNIKLLQSIPVQGTKKERFKVIGRVKVK